MGRWPYRGRDVCKYPTFFFLEFHVVYDMSAVMVDFLRPSPDELKSYVLKGVWKRYDEQPYQSLKWTLGNFSALLIFALAQS